MATTLNITDEVVTAFNEFKMSRKPNSLLVTKMDDTCANLNVERLENCDAKSIIKFLPKDECRFAFFDNGSKVSFIMWCPDIAPPKQRMVHSSTVSVVKSKLEGIAGHHIEAHDEEDLRQVQ